MSSIQSVCRSWTLRTKVLEFGEQPLLMGIVNVTPDSFSDGGKFFTPSLAVDQALRLEDEGADMVDIGGESTRPYSNPVAEDAELQRVVPVVEALVSRLSIPISIDTSKSRVARAALELGAEIVNDVTGLEGDPKMAEVARELGAGVCAMHMQGSPQTMQENPQYTDVVAEIAGYLASRDQALTDLGIPVEKICLDPGIGFGKTHQHNLELISRCDEFHRLGRPLLVGHSRKGFIAKLIGNKSLDRTAGTLGISLALANRRIQILRIHDVLATRQALSCYFAVQRA